MKARYPCRLLAAALLIASALSGCGAKDPATSASGDDDESDAGGDYPCSLLTAEQASSVIPDHDGGRVAHAGGSLIEGVDAYQCSYMTPKLDVLTVILNVAVDDARFEEIKPDFSLIGSARKLAIGDGAWQSGSADDLKITVMKGRTVVALQLMAPGASQKAAALETLARVVTEGADQPH